MTEVVPAVAVEEHRVRVVLLLVVARSKSGWTSCTLQDNRWSSSNRCQGRIHLRQHTSAVYLKGTWHDLLGRHSTPMIQIECCTWCRPCKGKRPAALSCR